MASSNYCDTSNPYIKYWMKVTETSVDTENNTSTVRVQIYARRINDYDQATNYGGLCYLYFYNEATGNWDDMGDNTWEYPNCPIYSNYDTEIYNDTFTVPHNDDGTKTLRLRSGFSLYAGGSYKLYSTPEYQEFVDYDTGNVGVPLTDIQTGDYNNVTVSILSTTHESVTIRVTASQSSNQWWYVINDFNPDWVKFDETTGTYKDVTIDGLKPSTTYEIRGSAQIVNSEVYGNSPAVKFKTSRYRHRNGNVVMLYEENETAFTSNGLGVLVDALSCEVTEERNGSFELTMTYPIDGAHYDDITYRRILYANPNKYDYPQPFRIYSISRPLNGTITVNAEHISYDLSGYTVKPFSSSSSSGAVSALTSSLDVACPFSFDTNIDETGDMVVKVPSSVRYVLGGSNESFLSVYGGEIQFDCFDVHILEERGEDRGVVIRYGKNLTDLTQDENCANVFSHVRPYFYKEETENGEKRATLVTLDGDENYQNGLVPVYSSHPGYYRILPVDMTSYFEATDDHKYPTKQELAELTQAYIAVNNLGIPEVSLTVSFLDVTDSPEYSELSTMETVRLCDTVTVKFPKLGVDAKAKCVKTVYDVLVGQYKSISIGVIKAELSSTISNQNRAISGNVTKTDLNDAIYNASNMISGSAVVTYGMTTNIEPGSTGYARIGRLYPIANYANAPIKIDVYRRGDWCPITLCLCFTSVSDVANTGINKFKYFDMSGYGINAFVYEVTSGRWDVYVEKTEAYDYISAVWSIPYYMRDRVVLDIPEALLSSAPSGAISATAF